MSTYDLNEERAYFRAEINRKGAMRVGAFTRRSLALIPESVHRMLLAEFPELNLPTIEEYEDDDEVTATAEPTPVVKGDAQQLAFF